MAKGVNAQGTDTSVEIDGDSSIIIRSRNREKSTTPIALTTRSGIRKHHKQRTVAVGRPDQLIHFAWLASVSDVDCGQANRIVPPSGVSSISPSALAAWNVRPGSEETNVPVTTALCCQGQQGMPEKPVRLLAWG